MNIRGKIMATRNEAEELIRQRVPESQVAEALVPITNALEEEIRALFASPSRIGGEWE